MITKVKITKPNGENITFNIKSKNNPEGIVLASITGHGPPETNINLKERAIWDGSIYDSSHVVYRELGFSFVYYDTLRVTKARQLMYNIFTSHTELTIEMFTEDKHVYTKGYVETNADTMFTSMCGTQINILCPTAQWTDMLFTTQKFWDINPEFEFPFSNESLSNKLIEFGSINTSGIKELLYVGNYSTGMFIEFQCRGEVVNPRFYKIDESIFIGIDSIKVLEYTGISLQDNDTILISTFSGDKYVYLIRDGITTDILNCLIPGSKWPVLTPGPNQLAKIAESGSENLYVTCTYANLYGGI